MPGQEAVGLSVRLSKESRGNGFVSLSRVGACSSLNPPCKMDGCREIAAAYNLLPNALLVLGGDALFPAFLNSGQAVFEGIHCLRGRSCPLILPFRFFPGGRIHFPIVILLWQSSGKVEKFCCVLSRG